MNAVVIITYLLATVIAISAVAIIFVKEVFHAALLLIVCLLCVAGIFVVFNAEFLAIVQLIVYAGGVLLLIIFGIMLTVRTGAGELADAANNKFISSIVGLSLFSIMVYAIGRPAAGTPITGLSPENIGVLLMTQFAIPFELAGVLLLVSLIAAIVVATNLKES